MATLTSENAALQNQLKAAQQNIANLNAEVSQLQGQVATLTSENAALQNQLKAVSQGLNSVQADFQKVFGNPHFTIPGLTTLQQYQNLVQAILNLNKGDKMGIYKDLAGN